MAVSFGWYYKGTKIHIRIGDKVELSAAAATKAGYNYGVVVGLQGFITVELPNGDRIDYDARSIKAKVT